MPIQPSPVPAGDDPQPDAVSARTAPDLAMQCAARGDLVPPAGDAVLDGGYLPIGLVAASPGVGRGLIVGGNRKPVRAFRVGMHIGGSVAQEGGSPA